MFSRNIWYRKSGPVSTTSVVFADCTRILDRSRLSFLLAEVHTSQLQAIIGTPLLVPVPRKVIFNGGQNIQMKYPQNNEGRWKDGEDQLFLS